MKAFRNKIIASISFMMLLGISSCDDDLGEINVNPNSPEVVPTYMLFSETTRYLFDNTRDEWWSARMTLPWMQYSAQLAYPEEGMYQYRDAQTNNGWFALYKSAQNLKSLIEFCENPETIAQMEGYGNVDNQIAVSRIMLAYIFEHLANHFGDIPYWSYSNQDPDFQALQIDTYLQPKYATQSKIYADILNELKLASEQLNTSAVVFNQGDNIYQGDAVKWKKLANSLRLRIANRVKAVYPDANAHITDAIASGVFTSNADNAVQGFFSTSTSANPLWFAYFGSTPRTDFAVNAEFVNLLKGETGNYGVDPRLQKMVAPKGLTPNEVAAGNYSETDDLSQYIGMPYGLPLDRIGANGVVGDTSFFSQTVLSATKGEVIIGYAEVQFILSEINGWDQTYYENGVRASMEEWGVDNSKITAFISSLPAANMENVITQKYVSLYMQSAEAWCDYRRTGYPNGTILILPGGTGYELDGTPFIFTPLISGNIIATDIPARLRYPINEANTNFDSYAAGVQQMGGNDEINVKLWWDVN